MDGAINWVSYPSDVCFSGRVNQIGTNPSSNVIHDLHMTQSQQTVKHQASKLFMSTNWRKLSLLVITLNMHFDCLNFIYFNFLFCGTFQISNKMSTIFIIFQTSKNHLCARYVFLRIFQILEKCFLSPLDS